MTVIQILRIVIAIAMIIFIVLELKDYIKNREPATGREIAIYQGIGFVVNFFDTLGIGSFAPTLALYHLTHTVDDRKIPGTLNVGVSFTVFLEALLFLGEVDVDPLTLVLTQIAAAVGAFVGARLNEKVNLKTIRLIMGAGLGVATILLLCSKFNLIPMGGDQMGLTGIKLVAVCITTFICGLLLPMGVGHYATVMVIIYLLGMAPIAAFPIMCTMGGLSTCVGGIRFLKNGLFCRQAALGQTIAGSVGVLTAFFLVKSLPLNVLQWLVILVVGYTSINMLSQGLKKQTSEKQEDDNERIGTVRESS